jgi:hypothetical protein
MKTLIVCILTILLGKGCNSEDLNEMSKANITYEAHTMGYFLKINIENNILSIQDKRDGDLRSRSLTDSEVKELAFLFKSVSLEQFKDYKGPTQKRFYDGAAIAGLTVEYGGETYATESFDHMEPPVEIAAFVYKLVTYANIQNDN